MASAYPWATEETMQQIANSVSSSAARQAALSTLLRKHSGSSAQVDRLLEDVEEASTESNKTRVEAFGDLFGALGKSASKSIQGKSFKDIYNAYEDQSLVEAAEELKSNLPVESAIAQKFGGALVKAARMFNVASAVVTGVGILVNRAYAKEGELRDAVGRGMFTENIKALETYKSLGKVISGEIEKFSASIDHAMPLMANVSANTAQGTLALTRFIYMSEMKSRQADFTDFGYTMQEYASRIADEAAIFAKLGEINRGEALENTRIKEAMELSEEVAMYMANAMGRDRSEMIAQRKEFFENIDFVEAWRHSSEHLVNKYGEESALRIRESLEAGLSELKQLGIDQSFIDELEQTTHRALRDVSTNVSLYDNMNQELLDTIPRVEGLEVLVKNIEDTLAGQLMDPRQMRARMAEGVELVKANEFYKDPSAPAQQANAIIRSALSVTGEVLESVKGVTTADVDTLKSAIETTDAIIDAADAAQSAANTASYVTDMGYGVAQTVASFVDFALVDPINSIFGTESEPLPPPVQLPAQETQRQQQRESIERGSVEATVPPMTNRTPTSSSNFTPTTSNALVAPRMSGNKLATAMKFFVDNGYSKAQAAGIVGNLMAESGQNLKIDAVGDGGMAYGIAQWHPPRQRDFEAYFGKSIRESTFQEQLEFILLELQRKERSANSRITQTTNAGQAAAVVDQFYERSSGAHRNRRIANANQLYAQYDAMIAELAQSATPEQMESLNRKLDSLSAQRKMLENHGNVDLTADEIRSRIAEYDREIIKIQEQINAKMQSMTLEVEN